MLMRGQRFLFIFSRKISLAAGTNVRAGPVLGAEEGGWIEAATADVTATSTSACGASELTFLAGAGAGAAAEL